MAPPTVGKQVFLRVATATTTVMRGMTSEDTTGQKAADGRKKSPATPVKKQTRTVLTKGKKKIGKGLPMQPSRQDGATWGRRERTYTKAAVFVPATAGLFLPPKADFLFLRLFSLPTGRRGWGWRRMSESVLSTTLPTTTNAKGAARKSRKSFCIYITLIMHTTTANDTFFLPFRLTMSIIIRTLTAVYAKRYNKTEWNDSLMTKEHETDYLFSMAANEMRMGMVAIRMR